MLIQDIAPIALRPLAAAHHGIPNLYEMCDYARCTLPGVCGNKARKLRDLCAMDELPPLVSHGGSQSNAMLALASLAAQRDVPFTYHMKPIPRWLQEKPTGNLAAALAKVLFSHSTHSDVTLRFFLYEMISHRHFFFSQGTFSLTQPILPICHTPILPIYHRHLFFSLGHGAGDTSDLRRVPRSRRAALWWSCGCRWGCSWG